MTKKAVSVRVTKTNPMDRRTQALADIAAIIEHLWGPKCTDYARDCGVCIAWKAFKKMEQLTDENSE